MRRLRLSLGLAALLLLWATPGRGAETLEMNCPVCDHVDVAGHGLEPNATLTLVIRDVRTGQTVRPQTQVTTDGSGSFEREFDMDLARHPSLLADPTARFHDLGADYHASRIDRDRKTRNLVHQLQALGHKVTLQPAA